MFLTLKKGKRRNLQRMTGGAFLLDLSALMHFVNFRRKLRRFTLRRIRRVTGQTGDAFAHLRMFLGHNRIVVFMAGDTGILF